MKRKAIAWVMMLALTIAAIPAARAADIPEVCYPTSIVQSEDGAELKRIYDLDPATDPAGISRSDFERGGFHYTLVEIMKQELPAYEEREQTETVSVNSPKKDMESVLALLPQEREIVTDDGLTGILTLKLDTVRVEPSGYGSITKEITATRTYPNLAGQDTESIPKAIEDGGRTLTLQNISWQTDNISNVDGYAIGDRFTATATYTTTATSSYIKGYTVTADYVGKVSHIALDRVRYAAIFSGTPLETKELPAKEVTVPLPALEEPTPSQFPWAAVLVPVGIIAVIGVAAGVALALKRRGESDTTEEST